MLFTAVFPKQPSLIGDLTPQPTVTSTSGTDSAGNSYVAVTVTWQFSTITGFPGVPQHVSLSRTIQMRLVPQ